MASKSISYYGILQPPWKVYADDYLASLNYCEVTIGSIRRRVSLFLYYLQDIGVTSPSEITFAIVEEYCNKLQLTRGESTNRNIYAAGDMLLFWADLELCEHSLGWYPYFFPRGSILHKENLTENQVKEIASVKEESLQFPAEEYARVIPDYLKQLELLGYGHTQIKSAHTALYNLLVFLGLNGLGYHADIAAIWLEHKKSSCNTVHWKRHRRTLNVFETFTKENAILPHKIYRNTPLLCEQLPEWCRKQLDPFLSMKRREGLDDDTVISYRSAVTRFCLFLIGRNIDSFSSITPSMIKEFNQQDTHLTPESKNAYNCRIKKFLSFLERNNILPFGINQSLYSKAATREKIVVTLNNEEKDIIAARLSEASTPFELRDRVMILLGLKMGLRPCDIVSIKLNDIDWDNQTIRIIQEKTDNEIVLPMPTQVGNAIYLYLKNGRPQSTSSSLIIRHCAPYDPIKASACDRLLKRILPERNIPRSNFCVTRKTFSTDNLRKGTKMQIVAELNGHSNIDSLKHYLQLDPCPMRSCGLSLKETGLTMKGDRYGDL